MLLVLVLLLLAMMCTCMHLLGCSKFFDCKTIILCILDQFLFLTRTAFLEGVQVIFLLLFSV